MVFENEEKYTEIVHGLLEFFPLFEKALGSVDVADEVRIFLLEDLDDTYSTLLELKEEIQYVSLPKKGLQPKITCLFILCNGEILWNWQG